MLKRGQSAMEFLMTYGWAILVVLIVLSSLYFLGVFNPKFVSSCEIKAPFVCKDFQAKDNGVIFSIGSGNIESGEITGITVNGEECDIISNSNIYSNQVSNVECLGLDLSDVSKINADVKITYLAKSGLSHEITGKGGGVKESGILTRHIPIDGNTALAMDFESYEEILGDEIIVDGGVENWNNPNNLVSWEKYESGGSTLNQESVVKHSGSYSTRLDISPINGNVFIKQNNVFESGKKYNISFWAKASNNIDRINVFFRGEGEEAPSFNIQTPSLTTNYERFEYGFTPTENGHLELGRNFEGNGAGKSIYFDDISLKELSFNFYDESQNSNDGTCAGTFCPSSVADGKIGNGLMFDGNDDFLVIPDDAVLNPGQNDFSLSAWIKTSSVQSQNIFYKYDGKGYIFQLKENNKIRVRFTDGNNNIDYDPGVFIADGSWHYVVLTVDRDDSSGLKIFVDGSQIGVSQDPTLIGNVNPQNNLFISSDNGQGNFFEGTIDEVRIFNKALSENEIQAYYSIGG